MIPKIIHYCWFGGKPLPELAQKCIASWKKFCPDYEIKRWDETNFDINCCDYVREAHDAKKWAFVSDYVRLYAMVKYGGIYMDTDVEVIKPIDDLLQCEALSGFEAERQIPTGLMACREGFPLFKEFLDEYDGIHFIKEDGTLDTTTNVIRITNICLKYGLKLNNTRQNIRGFVLLPKDYFCPKSYVTGKTIVTKNTYSIHHFDASWLPEEQRYRMKLLFKLNFLPRKDLVISFITLVKFKGWKAAFSKVWQWVKKKMRKDSHA